MPKRQLDSHLTSSGTSPDPSSADDRPAKVQRTDPGDPPTDPNLGPKPLEGRPQHLPARLCDPPAVIEPCADRERSTEHQTGLTRTRSDGSYDPRTTSHASHQRPPIYNRLGGFASDPGTRAPVWHRSQQEYPSEHRLLLSSLLTDASGSQHTSQTPSAQTHNMKRYSSEGGSSSRLMASPAPPSTRAKLGRVDQDSHPPAVLFSRTLTEKETREGEGVVAFRELAKREGADLKSITESHTSREDPEPKYEEKQTSPLPGDKAKETILALYAYPRPEPEHCGQYFPGVPQSRKEEMDKAREDLRNMEERFRTTTRQQMTAASETLEGTSPPLTPKYKYIG